MNPKALGSYGASVLCVLLAVGLASLLQDAVSDLALLGILAVLLIIATFLFWRSA